MYQQFYIINKIKISEGNISKIPISMNAEKKYKQRQ
jgi:hypothetical protein